MDRLDLDLATEIVRMNVAATAVLLGERADWIAPRIASDNEVDLMLAK
jgi:hypothetical protein